MIKKLIKRLQSLLGIDFDDQMQRDADERLRTWHATWVAEKAANEKRLAAQREADLKKADEEYYARRKKAREADDAMRRADTSDNSCLSQVAYQSMLGSSDDSHKGSSDHGTHSHDSGGHGTHHCSSNSSHSSCGGSSCGSSCGGSSGD